MREDQNEQIIREHKNSRNYDFTLLREEAVEADSFEDRTHDKIAETLCKLIKTEKGGVTVGLEGTWGSGKSAVISILHCKAQKPRYARSRYEESRLNLRQ
jgi:putative protein kinase ArgK-like GTPase of G3E family